MQTRHRQPPDSTGLSSVSLSMRVTCLGLEEGGNAKAVNEKLRDFTL